MRILNRSTSRRSLIFLCGSNGAGSGLFVAPEKARAASMGSAEVIVRCSGPTCGTHAAPMKSAAIRMLERSATSATPSYQTVSPDTWTAFSNASVKAITNPVTGVITCSLLYPSPVQPEREVRFSRRVYRERTVFSAGVNWRGLM